ncbi:MAG TPA: hypothetical protein VGJ22_08095 [Anaerolineales bacterium]|jgi:hypothetical protein
MDRVKILIGLLALSAAILACASPFGTPATAPPGNVETMVALTFQALTAPAPSGTPALAGPSLLPHSLYFLNNDGAGLLQVFRLAPDGTTLTQLTFEPALVNSFSASPVDGSLAFVSNNRLLLVNADGSGRRLLVDGGPMDENNPFLTSLGDPIWSPNGETIAFGQGGLNFYAVATGVSNRVLENQLENNDGFSFPRELYWPYRYSPDGTKLLTSLGYYEGGSFAVYYPAGSALVRLSGADDVICCSANWAADGSGFHIGRSTYGLWGPGLWRVDAATGAVTTLLSGIRLPDGSFNLADSPYLAPDGQLYYFFATLDPGDDFINRAPLQLVRSAPDGVTGRTVLRPETYDRVNEALWLPDASAVIVASAPIEDVFQGGQAELVYTDGRPVVILAPYAYQMQWGP